jgi:hypothetical protein
MELKKAALKKMLDTNVIAWEAVLSKIFSHRSRSYCINKNKPIAFIQSKCHRFEFFEQQYGFLGKDKTLVGIYTDDLKDIDIAIDLIKSCYSYIKNPHLCDLAVCEILTKVMAYRNLSIDTHFFLPYWNGDHSILQEYKIDRIFNLWNSMKAFGLKPINSSAPPILLFRGTEFCISSIGGRSSIVSNFDPKGPGVSIFMHARPMLVDWLKKVCTSDHKARAIGFSLGGALASYAVIHEPSYFSKDSYSKSFGFHQPGISLELYDLWNQIPENERPLFESYVAEGDFVSKYGKLFSTTFEISVKDQLSPIESHVSLFFIKPSCYLQEVDPTLENESHSRQSYSSFHQNTSNLLFKAGIKFLLPSEED